MNSFYVKKILAGLSPPTMHIIIASIFTAYTGRFRNAREKRGTMASHF